MKFNETGFSEVLFIL